MRRERILPRNTRTKSLTAAVSVALVLAIAPLSEAVAQEGKLLSASLDIRSLSARDYLEAQPMPLPMLDFAPTRILPSEPRDEGAEKEYWGASGKRGTGELSPEVLIPRRMLNRARREASLPELEPLAYGSAGQVPYTTSRVDMDGANLQILYPYSPTGRFFFTFGGGTFVCSASLIKKGVIITAAHCLYDNVAGVMISSGTFVPAYKDGLAPFGSYSAVDMMVWNSYADRSACIAGGVVCTNDIGVAILAKGAQWPGTAAGKYGYKTNGYGFTKSDESHFTQLGYPVSHDKGECMIRTDSQSFQDASLQNNHVWASSQTGGSSGGPELVNFGQKPKIKKPGTGAKKKTQAVVCVTSWGYTDKNQKLLGCSDFAKSTVKPLVDWACGEKPKPC